MELALRATGYLIMLLEQVKPAGAIKPCQRNNSARKVATCVVATPATSEATTNSAPKIRGECREQQPSCGALTAGNASYTL